MEKLNNGIVSIAVKDHGAELSSIRCGGREYLWQADAEFWARHSPVLFPIVGSVWAKEFRSHGRIFGMGQHGFARDMDFELLSHSGNEIWYRLRSGAETLLKYPYEFVLEVGYRLGTRERKRDIEVMWRVHNPGGEDLFFQIGAHPAFHWPMLSDSAIDAGTAAMKAELAETGKRGYFKFGLNAATRQLPKSVIGAGGCFDASLASSDTLDEEGMLPLDTASFDRDALVYENSLVNKVTLCGCDRKPYLSLSFDAPVVGLWSPPGKNAPFVCIEPWYGRADGCGYSGSFEAKPWINRLAPGASFNGGYTITLE